MIKLMRWEDVEKSAIDELSLEEQFGVLVEMMVQTMNDIKLLTRKIAAWRQGVDEYGEQVKAVLKALKGRAVKKELLKDILKGNVGFTNELFRKESDALKEYTKRLNYIV